MKSHPVLIRTRKDLMFPVRILIVDEHPEVLNRIETRLSQEDDFELVGTASNGAQAISIAKETKPEIILIDPIMQDGSGMRAIKEFRDQLPIASIVVLTAFVDTSTRVELEKAGVGSILVKGIDTGILVKTLRELINNQDKK
ncbi:MAG: response regulator transcription factor [Chloroflexi bacterium]|nr:response regulator transcription factor [Chloroflexota bacterium]